MFLKKPIKLTN